MILDLIRGGKRLELPASLPSGYVECIGAIFGSDRIIVISLHQTPRESEIPSRRRENPSPGK